MVAYHHSMFHFDFKPFKGLKKFIMITKGSFVDAHLGLSSDIEGK
jgi:hypothetical protein